jgi:hypothetical protein
MMREIGLAIKLEELYQVYKTLRGDQWQESVEDFKPYIEARMKEDRCNEIAAAVSLARSLREVGLDPREVLAVAVHIMKEKEGGAT